MQIELELPYPPSVNRYWRRVGPRTIISREGREYREAVAGILRDVGIPPFTGPVCVVIHAYMPDRRRRDLDNLLKATLDALAYGGAYHDDSQVDELHIYRAGLVKGCKMIVELSKR